jgi:hypothetical protein
MADPSAPPSERLPHTHEISTAREGGRDVDRVEEVRAKRLSSPARIDLRAHRQAGFPTTDTVSTTDTGLSVCGMGTHIT